MIKLVVFLGNPGKEYAKTRHNAGFIIADEIFTNASWSVKFHSAYAKEQGLIILKPMTFMNLSGTAVSEAATFFRIKPDEILVVHDDLELPLGEARLQQGGGLQGHNGLRSLKERLGSADFYRLRVGIGRPIHGDVKVYVTSDFKSDERIILAKIIDKIRDAILQKETKPAIYKV